MWPVFFLKKNPIYGLAHYSQHWAGNDTCLLLKVQTIMSSVANVHMARFYGKQLGSHEQSWKRNQVIK